MSAQTPPTDTPNADLLAILPQVERLVEVGCSTGALARAYRSRHPEAHWIGIEIDATYAAAARRYCQEVIIGDIEQLLHDPAATPALQAECWIFGDCLEHLRDPWQVLRRVHSLLPAGGTVCACIPNVQHWSLQARLCLGAFDYEDSGLLDRTHLRWFTASSMASLFESSGFQIKQQQPRIFHHPKANQALEQIRQFAQGLGGDPESAAHAARPYQFIIEAVKATA